MQVQSAEWFPFTFCRVVPIQEKLVVYHSISSLDNPNLKCDSLSTYIDVLASKVCLRSGAGEYFDVKSKGVVFRFYYGFLLLLKKFSF